MDAISQLRLAPLHPALIECYTQLDTKCLTKGIRLRITRGLATFAEQESLYAQGRTTPGSIVTNARGGYSAHEFWYALDTVPDDPSFPAWHPDWDKRDSRWTELLADALWCGLGEGACWSTFPDSPHLYLKDCPPTPTDEMRAAQDQTAVWGIIDRLLPPYCAPGLRTDI